MKSAIGYLRVSTREQGRSGLGLAAQGFEIESFGKHEGFAVTAWHQDVQTGAGADALLLRPGLATALKEAKSVRCPLMVSRLDRLSRNVHFITGLMEHKVHFVVKEAIERAEAYRVHIEWAFRQPGLDGGPISYRAVAQTPNARNIESPTGRRWRGHALQRMARRLGLDHPPGYLKDDVVRARVQAIWRQHPECTPTHVVASMGAAHSLGLERAAVFLT
jgi:hypothetical protein